MKSIGQSTFRHYPIHEGRLTPICRIKLCKAFKQIAYQTGRLSVVHLKSFPEATMQKRLFFFSRNDLDLFLGTGPLELRQQFLPKVYGFFSGKILISIRSALFTASDVAKYFRTSGSSITAPSSWVTY